MQNWLLDSLFQTDLKLIAAGRKVDEAKVRAGSTMPLTRRKKPRPPA